MHPTDTIAAVSSPPGRSLRGLIRISGPQARTILESLCPAGTEHRDVSPALEIPARQLATTRLQLHTHAGTSALPVMVAWFAAPRTYTGQDLVEIQVPGNPALLDRLLHVILARGARLAEPGEFTFRAYLAGKLDLTQAEGVAATIAAVSDSQLRAASALREGTLATLTRELVDDVGSALALVEAGIDFTDQDDVVPITPSDLHARLTAIQAKLTHLMARSRSWGAIEALPRVVLVGEPSTGKSTLFNALLGRTRAVISEVPGTTRDVLCEPLTLKSAAGSAGGVVRSSADAARGTATNLATATTEVMLVDIAGLDEPRQFLDRAMQDAARRAIAAADLALLIDDGRGMSCALIDAVPDHVARLRIRTKADRPGTRNAADTDLAVSAHTGLGLDELRDRIARRLADRAVSVAGEALALQPRHESCLRRALAAIADTLERLTPKRQDHALSDIELIADGLRGALDELASLGGALTPDDVIGRIFATFCVGK